MSAPEIEIIQLEGPTWSLDGKAITVPEGRRPEPYLLAVAASKFAPGTKARLVTETGARTILLRPLAIPAEAPVPAPAPAEPEPEEKDSERSDQDKPKARRKLLVIGAAAAAALTLAAAVIVPQLGQEETRPAWAQQWAVKPASGAVAPGAVQIAGAGVVLNIAEGGAEAYRLTDGEFIGSALAPKGFRTAVGPDFTVLANTAEGTTTGAVVTPEGVKTFGPEQGTLIRRGTVPFLAGGEGVSQYALLYRDGQWKKVGTPAPGLAPLAATEQSIMWLGTGRKITLTDHAGKVTSESTLTTPENGTEATQRAYATDAVIGVVWTATDGSKQLVTHSAATGEILHSAPVGNEVFDKVGAAIMSKADGKIRYWKLAQDGHAEAAAADCEKPILAGGNTWCSTEGGYTAGADSLPAGTTPITSTTTESIPAVSGGNLALYSR